MKERKLTDKEERIAQSLPDKEFKKRYGKDWKSVKIATATKMAKMKEAAIRKFIKGQIKSLHEAEVKGDIVNLHYKIDVYASPSDGDMSSVIDYVQNNEVVNKYGIKVEVGALESGPKEDESSVYVKFTIDRRKTAAMTAVRLLRDVVIEFVEKKIGAVAVDIEAKDFKPDGPSDAKYDQMAQDDEQDNLMRRAADMGYLDLEESGIEPGIDCVCQNNKRVNIPVDTFDKYLKEEQDGIECICQNGRRVNVPVDKFDKFIKPTSLDEVGPYKGGNLLPGAEDIDFDVKSIDMVYTDFGRFYGFYMYSEPGLKGQREKFSFRADVDDFLKSKGIKTEIPVGYDTDILDSIVADFKKQGIEAEYGDHMDVSENKDKDDYGRSVSGKDKRTFVDPKDLTRAARAKKLAGMKEEKSKEDQLKVARAAFKKAEMDGDIRGQELALAAIDLIKGKRIKGLGKSSRLKEIASELGYLNEITVSGGQEAARNYPPTENPGDMFAQKEVEELLPASFASRNQELKARMQGHANWAKQDRFNNTFVHFQSNTVSDGNNIYRIAMSQHYNGNYTGFKNPRFTEIRVKELDNESDMERDLGKYVVDTTALMQDLRKLETIERVS